MAKEIPLRSDTASSAASAAPPCGSEPACGKCSASHSRLITKGTTDQFYPATITTSMAATKNSLPSSATNRSIRTSGNINSGHRMVRHGRGVFGRILLLSVILLPSLSLANEKDFTIVVDSKLPDDGSMDVL